MSTERLLIFYTNGTENQRRNDFFDEEFGAVSSEAGDGRIFLFVETAPLRSVIGKSVEQQVAVRSLNKENVLNIIRKYGRAI